MTGSAPFDAEGARRGLVRHCWYPVNVLGPGRRLGIWFQGCTLDCRDCFSPHTREFDPTFETTIDALLPKLRKAALFTDSLTVSGGEPFAQAGFLYNLLRASRNEGFRDILVYSGFRIEELRVDELCTPALGEIDALIDGNFLVEQPTLRLWRGSANQRLLVLSRDPAIRERYENAVDSDESECRMQVGHDRGEDFVIGIPRRPLPDLRGGDA